MLDEWLRPRFRRADPYRTRWAIAIFPYFADSIVEVGYGRLHAPQELFTHFG